MRTELTQEQSQHLIDLGVDPKLASKRDGVISMGAGVRGIIKRPDPKPIFALTDLIEILPKQMGVSELMMHYKPESELWWVGYRITILKSAPELIDALYQLLCRVIERGYFNPKTEAK